MTRLWAAKVTSGAQQISNRLGSTTMLDPINLHRTADTCVAGSSRTLTANSVKRFRPAPHYLPVDTVLHDNYTIPAQYSVRLDCARTSALSTHTVMHRTIQPGGIPRLRLCTIRAPPAASVLDCRAVSATLRPSACAASRLTIMVLTFCMCVFITGEGESQNKGVCVYWLRPRARS